MKNLIDLNEEKKTVSQVINGNYAYGWNNCIDYLQDQYNIIIAPKQVKLSEILGKLNEKDYRKFEITRNGTCISLDSANCYRDYLNIEDNKIVDISDDMQVSEFKWLYSLWITETKIIDDMKEE